MKDESSQSNARPCSAGGAAELLMLHRGAKAPGYVRPVHSGRDHGRSSLTLPLRCGGQPGEKSGGTLVRCWRGAGAELQSCR